MKSLTTKPLEYFQLTIYITSKNFERFPLLLNDSFIGVVTVLLEYSSYCLHDCFLALYLNYGLNYNMYQ